MDLQKALDRNLVLKTEYGAGPRALGKLFRRRVLRRQRYLMDGSREEDIVHERAWSLGPVNVLHRSKNPGLFDRGDYELSVTLFKLFTVSNDKDLLVKLKAGVRVGVLKMLLAATPAVAAAEAVDLDLTARAGLRLNVSRFLRDLKKNDEEADSADAGEPDVDLH